MVTPLVRPFGISAGTATVLVFLESVFLGSLPTLVLVATFVGPFVPLVSGAWGRRRVLTDQDVQYVYEPVYTDLVKSRDQIRSAREYGQIPLIQRSNIDAIRVGARYSFLKNRTPKLEEFFQALDFIYSNQVSAARTVTKIIGDVIRSNPGVFLYDGDGISFSGVNTDGEKMNVPSSWIPVMLLQNVDPLSYWKQQINIASVDIVDNRNNNIKGSLPFPEKEPVLRSLWDSVKQEAEKDSLIGKMRGILSGLAIIETEAENQVLKEIRKSRSIFQ